MQEVREVDIQPLQPVHFDYSHHYQNPPNYQNIVSPSFTNPTTQPFIDEARSIERGLDEILSNITSIQSIQTQITISTSEQQEISLISSRDSIMNSTKDLLNTTKNSIKSLEMQDLRMNRLSNIMEDMGLRNQRINHLKEKFVACLETYRNIEVIYLDKQKERLSRQYKIVNPDADNDEIEEYLKHPTDQPIFLQGAVGQRKSFKDPTYVLNEVNKRHNDIKKIETTIAELVDLFKEIQLQVELKDDHIVSITEEAQTVEIHVREASEQLIQATEDAESTRKMRWFCFAFSFAVFCIIVSIVILMLKHN